MARASASLRTTWRCTWLLAGTSMTTSARTRAEHDSRRPGASGARLAKRCSGSLSRREAGASRTTRRAWRTRPPRPAPGSVRTARGRRRPNRCPRPGCARPAAAACPCGKWPRLPEGMNTTSGSRSAMRLGRLAAGAAPMAALAAAARRLGRAGDPVRRPAGGGASRKRRIQRAQSGSWPIMTSAPMHRLDRPRRAADW